MADSPDTPSEDIGDILKGAHGESPEIESNAPDIPKKGKRLGKYSGYKNFSLNDTDKREEYDINWLKTNLGAVGTEEYEGQPTKTAEVFLKRLQDDQSEMLKFQMAHCMQRVKIIDKRNSANMDVSKSFEDDARTSIACYEEMKAQYIKKGMRKK